MIDMQVISFNYIVPEMYEILYESTQQLKTTIKRIYFRVDNGNPLDTRKSHIRRI